MMSSRAVPVACARPEDAALGEILSLGCVGSPKSSLGWSKELVVNPLVRGALVFSAIGATCLRLKIRAADPMTKTSSS